MTVLLHSLTFATFTQHIWYFTRTHEGTLRVVPFTKLSTSYIMLRPFFKPKPRCQTLLEPEDWDLNLEDGEFPGTSPGWTQTLTPESYPHLQLDKTIVSIDFDEPGDQVYCMPSPNRIAGSWYGLA